MAEQAKIEAQLHELEGMRDIQVGLELTHIGEDEQMCVDKAPPEPRPIEAKLRALEKFVRVVPPSPSRPPTVAALALSQSVCSSFILMMCFRGALSVNNTATRCRDYRLKKLWNLSNRHTPRISRGNSVY
jgi:hypothetical protein